MADPAGQRTTDAPTDPPAGYGFGDGTAETLAYLGALRRDARWEKRKSGAFALYAVALVGLAWGVPLLVSAARAGRADGPRGPLAAHVLTSLPLTVPTVVTLVVLLMARGAVWRGPVLLDMPTVSWLLPAPLSRAPLLLPRLMTSALLAGAVGAVTGGVLGFLAYASGAPSWPAVTGGGAWAGTVAALIGTAAGAVVERRDRLMARHGARLFSAAGLVLAAPVATAAVSVARGGHAAWLGTAFLWSGPWGWAAQPLVAAAGQPVSGWAVGAVLSAVFVLVALLWARREAVGISQAALRLRATVASQLGASLFALDLRQAKAGLPALRERGSRPALRLPMPRHRPLVIPWRDATGLLRTPGRLGWAAGWTATAVTLTVLAPTLRERAQAVAAIGALLSGYLAAAQLTEPARRESDDVRRSANLPYPPRSLALWHGLVPGVLLVAGTAAGGVAAALGGWGRPGLAVLIVCAPALVAAALVSSYRGAVPPHILLGGETPMGNTGAVQAAFWYLRGPLAALVLTAPVLVAVTRSGTLHAGQLGWPLLVGAVGLWWAGRTAHRLYAR
ncbi:DUF6297 family protein [Streptomyces himastatinicus]|uniref:DUF6297 family protein n=1 Tax=Streptomyces himastatinicus TaxID=998084 RepID=UPI0001B5192C|nr:DUF6297 family protein [Streptomyces himastatinicus]